MARLLILVAAVALLRAWFRRRRRGVPEAPSAPPDERAEELRRKLDESRAPADDQEVVASGETPVDARTVEERRREVHEQGRAAIDELRREE